MALRIITADERLAEPRSVKAAIVGKPAGDKVYWDNTAKEVTKTATANTLIGAAIDAVGGGAGETTGRVRLNASA